mmetsp:Transcript_45859/g.143487  ORF Transcript_45859/g.143487 Transcript_45859/m.143487 type:complete len:524 (-) Transcript_45859:36-1607(-)
MAFELLLGRGIQGGGSVKRRLKEHEAALRAALPADVVKQQQKQQNRPDSSGFSRRRPRYVRLNTLHQSDANALVELRELMNSAPGAEEKSKGKGKGKGRGKSKDEGKSKHAQQEGALADAVDTILDAHVPHLLALAPAEDADKRSFAAALRRLATSALVTGGGAVLQDKASCFSAQALLGGGWGWGDAAGDIIDACAAPGNKTTHAGALLQEWWAAMPQAEQRAAYGGKRPRVLGLDKDKPRAETLARRCALLCGEKHAGLIDATQGDFLETAPDDKRFARVRGVLLDPSCSGSGMIRPEDARAAGGDGGDAGAADEREQRRIRGLAAFQSRALAHAMSFPQVKRVVYSTCSLHRAENEDVVAGALEGRRDDWRLVPVLQDWPRRGEAGGKAHGGISEEEATALVRARPEDGTHGFFVACFQRVNVESDREHPARPAGSGAAKSAVAPRGKKRARESGGGEGAATGGAAATAKDGAEAAAPSSDGGGVSGGGVSGGGKRRKRSAAARAARKANKRKKRQASND